MPAKEQEIDDDLLKRRRSKVTPAEVPSFSKIKKMSFDCSEFLFSPFKKRTSDFKDIDNMVFKTQSSKRIKYANLQAFESEITGVKASQRVLTKPVYSVQKQMSMHNPSMHRVAAARSI